MESTLLVEVKGVSFDGLYQQSVTGQVVDENGVPLPGVSVLEKGTTNGVAADFDGNYSITVGGENSTLVFSYIGYSSKEVLVGASSTVDVQMELDASQLDEVIVVGYGTQIKAKVTNAVVQVSGETINKSPSVSMANSLAGRMSGVFITQNSSTPGRDDATIQVRGTNTYRNSGALIVIDGVANADGIDRLDPNDIETVTVLKDASAAIYGAQSAGGVILITTKRGKTGKMEVDYSSSLSFQSLAKQREYANAVDYMNIVNSADVLSGRDLSFPNEIIADFESGARKSEDWLDAFYGGRSALQKRQSLTMSGGSERIRYFTSLGTSSQGGLLVGDNKTKNRQYNVRMNLDVKASENLDLGLDIALRQKNSQYPQGGGAGGSGNTSPLVEAFVDGDTRYPTQGWSHLNQAARVRGVGYQREADHVLTSKFTYKYRVPGVVGLSLEGFAAFNRTWQYDKAFNWPWDYWEKNIDGEIIKVKARDIDPEGLTERFEQEEAITLNARIAYTTTFGEDHRVDAFVAYEQSEGKGNYFWTSRLGFASKSIDQLFAGSEDTANFRNFGSGSENARRNYFGRLSYDYKSKYLFGFNFRYDGSITFPKESRFGFFPGVSAGWTISEEPFFKNNLMNHLKLRGSWGQLGNDRVDQFQYLRVYKYSEPPGFGVIGDGYVWGNQDIKGVIPDGVANPNITWEVSDNLDIGLEMGLFDGALNLEIDYFMINTTNILGRRIASIPAYTGLDLPDENIGEMENKGFDFSFRYNQNIGELNLGLGGTLTYAKNKIIYFDETPTDFKYQKLEGQPFGSNLVYEAIGIYRTQADLDNNINYPNAGLGELIFADLSGDGQINSDDRYRYDPLQTPRLQFGLNWDLNYKNFDFTVLFQGASKVQRTLSNGFNSGAAGNSFDYAAQNSYTVDRTDAPLPRVGTTTLGNSASDFWYRDASYVRLKSMEFGYSFPKDLMNKFGIDQLRFFTSGYNLLTFSKLDKYGYGDPEQDNGGFPPVKTISFGLNLAF
ncbi:TonB-dependent receptor [Arenibacter sp. BSSL-BM3]|uniref:TonB-dependent receptor n=1 Tax=Arenibacter arenosicollis TaxID=2762274 RepID=A0ABR7QTM3_9FLAO|nr:TonB-dependent receptor [Arenibacter arenosicollis]MBC8770526.1 TonB-dependent receptor [Arenibacter arenosicollis]